MPVGLQCFDPQGNTIFDTTTMTGRILGSRVVSTNGYLERLTVPVSAGKRLWWYHYRSGTRAAYAYRATFTNPALNQGPNEFTLQTDTGNGSAFFFWGEY